MTQKVLLLFMLVFPLVVSAQDVTDVPALSEEMTTVFDYDRNVPLDVQVLSSEMRGDITVKDITYASPVDGDPIAAYLVLPPGETPHPAILYVHWLEDGEPTSNRTEFLDEAVMMAQEDGVIGLLIQTMWATPGWYRSGRTLETDYNDTVQQAVEIRRALDVLQAQPEVDAENIAFVGHDFGGMYGAILAGVDRRPTAYVIIASTSDFNNWMLFGVPPTREGLDEYRAQMAPLAPRHFIAHAAPAPVLFQFGTEDFYTPQAVIDEFYAAASEPKQLKTYATGHAMALDEIRSDRIAFLREQLGLER